MANGLHAGRHEKNVPAQGRSTLRIKGRLTAGLAPGPGAARGTRARYAKEFKQLNYLIGFFDDEEADLAFKTYANLLRRWSE